jgi:hypothetical protein
VSDSITKCKNLLNLAKVDDADLVMKLYGQIRMPLPGSIEHIKDCHALVRSTNNIPDHIFIGKLTVYSDFFHHLNFKVFTKFESRPVRRQPFSHSTAPLNRHCLSRSTSLPGHPIIQTSTQAMCQFEKLNYGCGHEQFRIFKHCHFARNDPDHRCYGAWSISKELNAHQNKCPRCTTGEALMHPQYQGHAGFVGMRQ